MKGQGGEITSLQPLPNRFLVRRRFGFYVAVYILLYDRTTKEKKHTKKKKLAVQYRLIKRVVLALNIIYLTRR